MQEKTGRWGNKRKVDHEFKKTLLENLRPENIHEIQIENFKKKNKTKQKLKLQMDLEIQHRILEFTVAVWYTHRYHDDTF